MRQLWRASWKRLLIAVLAFLPVWGLCVTAVLAVPYMGHRAFLTDLADRLAQSCRQGEGLSVLEPYSIGALVYDASGQCVAQKMPNSFHASQSVQEVFGRWPQQALPRVLRGKPAAGVVLLARRRLGVIYIGRPVCRNGEVVGAAFLVRDLHDLYPTLVSVCAACAIGFLSVSACLVFDSRKNLKYQALQRSYVSSVTHDLKSPITSIRALTEAMQAGVVGDEQTRQKYYGMILQESQTLQNTVSDILELSALQSRRTALSKQTVRLADVLKPVVEKYALLCGDRVSLRVCADFEELPPVETDPKSIARIADILLNNGMKFTGENGVIWLDAAVDSRAVTLCVRDNGVGIPRKDQGRIFERFYMGDPSHNANGSGLGLAIARELTDRSKEKLWVESEPGRGAAFFFTVRRA